FTVGQPVVDAEQDGGGVDRAQRPRGGDRALRADRAVRQAGGVEQHPGRVHRGGADLMWPLTRILNLGMVPLRGDCTLEGEKRFNGTTRIVAVLSGPRRNVLTKDDPSVSDSFAFITTDGPFEIPATAGVHYWIELGGDHDITFDGKQLDISDENWGTGDRKSTR